MDGSDIFKVLIGIESLFEISDLFVQLLILNLDLFQVFWSYVESRRRFWVFGNDLLSFSSQILNNFSLLYHFFLDFSKIFINHKFFIIDWLASFILLFQFAILTTKYRQIGFLIWKQLCELIFSIFISFHGRKIILFFIFEDNFFKLGFHELSHSPWRFFLDRSW